MQTQLPAVPAKFSGNPQDLGNYQGFELYPMPVYLQFSVPDPEETAQWYIDALGFGVMFVSKSNPDRPAALVHLRRRKYQDILLVPGEPQGGGASFDATGELETLAARSKSYCTHEGIKSGGYGPPMLHLIDPHGHKLSFFMKPKHIDPNKFKKPE